MNHFFDWNHQPSFSIKGLACNNVFVTSKYVRFRDKNLMERAAYLFSCDQILKKKLPTRKTPSTI